MPDIFDLLETPLEKNELGLSQTILQNQDIFDVVEPEFKESRAKSIARWIYQIPSALLQYSKYSYPLDFLQLLGTGEALDPEEIEQIRRISEREGIPFDEEKYLQSVQQAASLFPTQSNLEEFIEEKTGLPLTPKTRGQKGLKFLVGATKLAPRGATFRGIPKAQQVPLPKLALGTGLEATNELLQEAGVPEPFSNLLSFAALRQPPRGTPPLPPKKGRITPQQLEAEAVSAAGGENPPLGIRKPFETSEQILQELQTGEAATLAEQEALQAAERQKLQEQRGVKAVQRQIAEQRPQSLAGRIREGGEELGITVSRPPPRQQPDLKTTVGNQISPYEVHNSTNAGRFLKREVMRLDAAEYANVNRSYEVSRELNSGIQDIQPELAQRLENRIRQLESISDRSSVTNQLLRSNRNILNRLVAFDEEGNISGYRPITNQELIDQVQEIRRILDFDFEHGNPKNIFRPLTEDLQDAVIETAQRINPEAARANIEARTAYREWSREFDNDYMRPLRDISNEDFSKIFNKATDIDDFNVFRRTLERTPGGEELVNLLEREIVEKRLDKYFGNQRNINTREFERDLRELEPVIGQERVNQVRSTFRNYATRFPRKARLIQGPETSTKTEKAIAKYAQRKPEDIQKLMDSRSGIRELEQKLTTPKQKELFNKAKQEKVQSIFREGNIEKDFSGNDLYNVINKEKNFELLSELTSPEEAEALREIAKQIADRKFTAENLKKIGAHLVKYKTLKFLLTL